MSVDDVYLTSCGRIVLPGDVLIAEQGLFPLVHANMRMLGGKGGRTGHMHSCSIDFKGLMSMKCSLMP